ncbi:MAG TPA: hypothetical protein VM938_07430 [Acidimicrobiales bacterium]|nr:hypothetical protein [Acidimicrobiales bacterium]
MIERRRLTRLFLGVLAILGLAVGPAPADTYVSGTTFVARGANTTAADIGLVQCSPTPAPSTGGACIPWSGGGGGIEVVDAVNGHDVAFQVCVDNDGDGFCGGLPLVAGCDDFIVFSHFDNGSFSNPLAAPTAFKSGCPGGFRGWVVFLCQGAHVDTTPHTHEVTTGTITAAGGGGPSGTFCGTPLGKPYIHTSLVNGCAVQGTMTTGQPMYQLGVGPVASGVPFSMSFSVGACSSTTSASASGTISGSCFAATGSGQVNGRGFTFVWAGSQMELTPVGVNGAAGTLAVLPDAAGGQSCATGATRFVVAGVLAIT